MTQPDETPWDLWEVDDAHRHSTLIKQDGLKGEMLKEADRMNEAMDNLGLRYIALPQGEEPVFNSLVPPQAKPVPPVTPAMKPRITNQWVCDLRESDQGSACSAAMPHGPGYNCGYWHFLQLPSNFVSDDLMKLALKLLRIGALTSGNISRRPPAY